MSSVPRSTARAFAQPGQNRILELLPATGRERLLAHAQQRSFGLSDTLVPPNRPLRHVLFPTTCVGSALTVMGDGSAVETGTIGNEGFIGLQVLFGVGSVPDETVCQIPGEALIIPADAFATALDASSALRHVLMRYTQYVLTLSSQSTACNRLHTVPQRYARWVLMTHDRVGRDDFSLTQEFLAMMLGVRRASVSVAASALRDAGVVDYNRGAVRVVDRPGLEGASCECYRATRDEYDRLLGNHHSGLI